MIREKQLFAFDLVSGDGLLPFRRAHPLDEGVAPHSLGKPETLVPVYAMVNRIRLRASQQVLAEAERLVGRITEQYFPNNLSVQELRQLARSGEADALKAFGEVCRLELKSIRARG